METLEAIKKRASLKMYISTRDVEPEKIVKILDAARLAPSGRNKQPWRFIVVRGKEAVENLVRKAFTEVNHPACAAPVMIVVCANPDDALVTGGREYYLFDVGLAVENMLLAATELGLATHAMTGLDESQLKKILDIPPQVRFVVATLLAYPAASSYEEASKERLSQRSRKGLEELVYSGAWGKPFKL